MFRLCSFIVVCLAAARVLGLTPHTVAGYVKTVYRKLNISSRAEAAIEAVRRGLV